MKTLLANVTLALALILPATAGAATVGTTTVHSRGAGLEKGAATAYLFRAASTGPVGSLKVYLDGASTASSVEVGLYSGSVSSTGAEGRRCRISSPQPNAWSTCSFSPYQISAGSYYLLALLHPAASRGRLRLREAQVSGAVSYLSRNRSLRSLPSTWANSSRSSGAYQASIVADECPGTPVAAHGCPITPPRPEPACSDGEDNDGDGQVDYPSDPGCSSASDDDEANVIDPLPPSRDCDLNATPSTFAGQVAAAAAGQAICLASGNYGTWAGTNKAITVRRADGATPTMRFSFGSGDAGFTVDGVSAAGGTLGGGVSNVSVKNSAFDTCMHFSGSNSGVVFEGNTHLNIDATCGNARLDMGGSGVTVRNSLMQGGDSDGVFIASDDVTIDNNRIIDLCEGPTGNHTDGIQYEDPNGVDTPDSANTSGHDAIVRRNYISFVGCGGYGQALASYDSGTEGALIEDNVVDTTRPAGIELYSDDGSIVRHNTVRFYAEGPCAFTGQTCGKIELNRKTHDAAGVGTQVYDNVGQVVFANGSTAGRNDHNTDPSTVSYLGPLTGWAGFALAAGSPGSNAASDGSDTGIRAP